MKAMLERTRVKVESSPWWLRCNVLSSLLVLTSVCFALQEQDASKNPLPHYGAAQKYLAAGEEQQASAEFKVYLTSVVRSLATAVAQTGHLDKAEPLFEEAVSLSPAGVDLRMEYSRVLFNRAQFLQAKEQAKKAVDLEPQNSEAVLLLGQVLYQLRDYSGARKQLEMVFSKDPQFAVGYLLGKADLLLHDDKAARSVFDSTLQHWGNTDINHVFLGRAYSQAGYPNEAAAEFNKALQINPKAQGAHYQLALSYLRED